MGRALRIGLAAALLTLAAHPAGADSIFYRYITGQKDDVPQKPAQTPKKTESFLTLTGSKVIAPGATLVSLGLDPHAALVLNGTVLGGSDITYWSRSTDSDIGDLCERVLRLPGGPWECTLVPGSVSVPGYVLYIANHDITSTIDFTSIVNTQVTVDPPELFGSYPRHDTKTVNTY